MNLKTGKKRKSRAIAERTCSDCAYTVNSDHTHCPRCGAGLPPVPTSTRGKPKHFEDDHQQSLFEWARWAKGTMPDLAKLYHVPNGGARSGAEAGRLKAQGVVAGVLDLSLDVARGGYFGLRIELKATKAELGRKPEVSKEQRRRIEDLRADGYFADVCEGWEQARDSLVAYVLHPRTKVQP